MSEKKPTRQRAGFEDINSSSTGTQSKPDWFNQRPQRSSARDSAAVRQRSDTRSTRDRNPPSRGKRRPPEGKARSAQNPRSSGRSASSRSAREAPPRKRKKHMSLFKRRLLIVLAVLGMLAGTIFLAESLLFRVTEVRVTGDPVYAEEDILKICGFKTGDNLLLIPASDRERRLESQLPYIAKANITRKIPGTVQIEITAAKGLCCIEAQGQWYTVAAGGKVLESGAGPREGLMQVLGVTPRSARVGEKLELDEEEVSSVFMELLGTISALCEEGRNPAEEFTKMDLTDLYNIRIWYQDRVECVLGSSSQLEYKLRWGYGNLTDPDDGIGPEERGVLDLSYLPTKKRSYFTPSEGSTTGTPTPAPDGTVPDQPAATPEPGRGSDIPDAPFTG